MKQWNDKSVLMSEAVHRKAKHAAKELTWLPSKHSLAATSSEPITTTELLCI